MTLAIDCATKVGLADYTWLPAEYHSVFQAALEKEDGIAALHFLAEVERYSGGGVVPSIVAGADIYGSRLSNLPGLARSAPQVLRTELRIIAVSRVAVYVCHPTAAISRCVPLRQVEGIFTVDDWTCLVMPSTGCDLMFRATPRNMNKRCQQSYFVDMLNSLRQYKSMSILRPKALSDLGSLTKRKLTKSSSLSPSASRAPPPQNHHSGQDGVVGGKETDAVEEQPLAIPIIPWAELRHCANSDVIVRSLLANHSALCSETARTDMAMKWERYQQEGKRQQRSPSPSSRSKGGGLSPSSSPARGAKNTSGATGKQKHVEFSSTSLSPGRASRVPSPTHTSPSSRRSEMGLRVPSAGYRQPPVDASPPKEDRREQHQQHSADGGQGGPSPPLSISLQQVWEELTSQRRAIQVIEQQLAMVLDQLNLANSTDIIKNGHEGHTKKTSSIGSSPTASSSPPRRAPVGSKVRGDPVQKGARLSPSSTGSNRRRLPHSGAVDRGEEMPMEDEEEELDFYDDGQESYDYDDDYRCYEEKNDNDTTRRRGERGFPLHRVVRSSILAPQRATPSPSSASRNKKRSSYVDPSSRATYTQHNSPQGGAGRRSVEELTPFQRALAARFLYGGEKEPAVGEGRAGGTDAAAVYSPPHQALFATAARSAGPVSGDHSEEERRHRYQRRQEEQPHEFERPTSNTMGSHGGAAGREEEDIYRYSPSRERRRPLPSDYIDSEQPHYRALTHSLRDREEANVEAQLHRAHQQLALGRGRPDWRR